jgi:hypothetical protein
VVIAPSTIVVVIGIVAAAGSRCCVSSVRVVL